MLSPLSIRVHRSYRGQTDVMGPYDHSLTLAQFGGNSAVNRVESGGSTLPYQGLPVNKASQLVRTIIGAYIVVGIVIFLLQTFAGVSCDSLLGERRASGRESLMMTILLWPADLANHAGSGAPLGEYFVPTRCIPGA